MANWRSYIDPSIGDGQNTIDGIIANGSTYGLQISDDLSVTGLSTFSDIARFSSTIRLDGQLRDGDNNFGSSGQVLSSDGTDTRWINAAQLSAGAASQVAVNDDSNTNAERFITLVDSSSGNNNIKTDGSLKYNPSTNTITTVNITGNVTGNLTGNVTGNVTGNASGNSGSATVLQTSRTIGGVSFNGSSNINLPGVNQAGNQNTSGNAATASKLATSRQIGGIAFDGTANINLPGVNQTGNQNTSGNAATATVLETTRDFSVSGEITANAQSFNGSGNVTLSATVDDNVIDEANLKISNSPTNGRFLQCNTGVSGGLTWAEVTLPTSNTLSGSTLASGITASSITSLGTLTGLTVNGSASITGVLTLNPNNNRVLILDRNIVSPANYYNDLQIEVRATSGTAGIGLHRNGHSHVGMYTNASNVLKFNYNAGTVTLNHNTGTVWGSGNDGSGSGLDADVLDGQDSSYYRNAGNLNAGTIPDARLSSSSLFVTGMIIMWNGAANAIPSGWVLCDGNNNTPNLVARFIIGAAGSGSYQPGYTGGSSSILLGTANLPAHTHQLGGTVGNTNLSHNHSFSGSTNNPGNHNHSYSKPNDVSDDDYSGTPVGSNGQVGGVFQNNSTGNAGGHTHSVSGSIGHSLGNHNHSLPATTGNQGGAMNTAFDNRPPYYALCYIMKT